MFKKIKNFILEEKLFRIKAFELFRFLDEINYTESESYNNIVKFFSLKNKKIKEKPHKLLIWFITLNSESQRRFLTENKKFYNDPHLVNLFFHEITNISKEVLFANFMINKYNEDYYGRLHSGSEYICHYFEMNEDLLKIIKSERIKKQIEFLGANYIRFILDTLKNRKGFSNSLEYYESLVFVFNHSKEMNVPPVDLIDRMFTSELIQKINAKEKYVHDLFGFIAKNNTPEEIKVITRFLEGNIEVKSLYENLILKEKVNNDFEKRTDDYDLKNSKRRL